MRNKKFYVDERFIGRLSIVWNERKKIYKICENCGARVLIWYWFWLGYWSRFFFLARNLGVLIDLFQFDLNFECFDVKHHNKLVWFIVWEMINRCMLAFFAIGVHELIIGFMPTKKIKSKYISNFLI